MPLVLPGQLVLQESQGLPDRQAQPGLLEKLELLVQPAQPAQRVLRVHQVHQDQQVQPELQVYQELLVQPDQPVQPE